MKKLITFQDIDDARKFLDLKKMASMEDVKNNYRRLLLEFHPDRHNNSPDKKIFEEKAKELNNAYKIIMTYCMKYPISFDVDKVKDVEDGEYIQDQQRRFYDGWVSSKE